ncbi:hypothetical protein GCM10027515_31580 [Schumannella luteola]
MSRALRRSTTSASRSRRNATLLAVVLLGAGLGIGVATVRRTTTAQPATPIRLRGTASARPVGLATLRDSAASPLAVRALALGRRGARGAARAAARTSIRGVLASAAAIGVAVVAVSTGVGGTYAFINAQAPASNGLTITAGAPALKVTGSTGTNVIPASTWTNLLPGDSGRQAITISNTGDAPMKLSAKVAGATPYTVGVIYNATCASTATPITLGATSASLSAASLAKNGGSVTACVVVTVPANAASSTQAAANVFTLTIDAAQAAS